MLTFATAMCIKIKGHGMRCRCPHCSKRVRQARNASGPNFCPKCYKLFYPPPEEKVPPWTLGVVVVLMAHLQITMNTMGIV